MSNFAVLENTMLLAAAASSITHPSEIALLTEHLQHAFRGILEMRQCSLPILAAESDTDIIEIASSTPPVKHQNTLIGFSVTSNLDVTTHETSGYRLESQFGAQVCVALPLSQGFFSLYNAIY